MAAEQATFGTRPRFAMQPIAQLMDLHRPCQHHSMIIAEQAKIENSEIATFSSGCDLQSEVAEGMD